MAKMQGAANKTVVRILRTANERGKAPMQGAANKTVVRALRTAKGAKRAGGKG